MRMPTLDLDYLRPHRRRGWASYVLLAAALAFGAHQTAYYQKLKNEVLAMEVSAARHVSARTGVLRISRANDVNADEMAYAHETAARLSTPWGVLFRAVEAAHSDEVTLVSIEPDAPVRTIAIGGEAKDYLAALTYAANLAEQQPLKRVHLIRHEVQARAGARLLAFTVSAGWEETH